MQNGQWVLLPYELVIKNLLNVLHLNPLGMVPQQDCHPDVIIDQQVEKKQMYESL
jgi:hypothetical protein